MFLVLKNKSGAQLKRIKKSLQKTVKAFGLEILAESTIRILNYLVDVTMNLNSDLFKIYNKTYYITQCIKKESNHSPYIISTCLHLLKKSFQTIVPMKVHLKNQLFIMKIH